MIELFFEVAPILGGAWLFSLIIAACLMRPVEQNNK